MMTRRKILGILALMPFLGRCFGADKASMLEHWRSRISQEAIRRSIYRHEGLDSKLVGSGNAGIFLGYSIEKQSWIRIAYAYWNSGRCCDGTIQTQLYESEEDAVSTMNEGWLQNFFGSVEEYRIKKGYVA